MRNFNESKLFIIGSHISINYYNRFLLLSKYFCQQFDFGVGNQFRSNLGPISQLIKF
jgi:hypothetical protein